MRRPKLLIAAAREAASRMRNRQVLSLDMLEEREEHLDISRRARAADYDVVQHVEVLARLLVARRAKA